MPIALPSNEPAPFDSALPAPRSEAYAALLEAIVHSSDDAILTKNLDGIITSWNPAATTLFGYAPEEIIGQSILRLIPEHLHPEEAEVMERLKEGGIIAHHETVRLTRDGRELCVSLTVSPLKNERGELIGASKIVRDITEQKQFDSARRRLAAIVESSDDAILSKDTNGIIRTWNAAAGRLFGYTEPEIVGQSILTLIPPDLQSEEKGIMRQLLQGERIEHFETTRIRKNGERFSASLTISPIYDSSGKIVGASKILRDISARKRLENSLLEAEKFAATGRMAATIAHEINNPLEGLLNLIYLARTGSTSPEVIGFLEAAEGELERVSHIARQTLGYYREDTLPVPVSLAEIIEHVLRIYHPQLISSHIKVRTEIVPVPALVIKRGEIMQVLSNIVANAIHAMSAGGELTVSLQPSHSEGRDLVLLEIQDNGTGIPTENLERIFDPFFTTRGSLGTGIGLWIARQFVEGYGGRLAVRSSTEPNFSGTTLSISLPARSSTEPDPGPRAN